MNLKGYIQAHLERQKVLIKRIVQQERTFLKKIGIKLQEKVYRMEDEFLVMPDDDDKPDEVIFKKDIINTHDNKNI